MRVGGDQNSKRAARARPLVLSRGDFFLTPRFFRAVDPRRMAAAMPHEVGIGSRPLHEPRLSVRLGGGITCEPEEGWPATALAHFCRNKLLHVVIAR